MTRGGTAFLIRYWKSVQDGGSIPGQDTKRGSTHRFPLSDQYRLSGAGSPRPAAHAAHRPGGSEKDMFSIACNSVTGTGVRAQETRPHGWPTLEDHSAEGHRQMDSLSTIKTFQSELTTILRFLCITAAEVATGASSLIWGTYVAKPSDWRTSW